MASAPPTAAAAAAPAPTIDVEVLVSAITTANSSGGSSSGGTAGGVAAQLSVVDRAGLVNSPDATLKAINQLKSTEPTVCIAMLQAIGPKCTGSPQWFQAAATVLSSATSEHVAPVMSRVEAVAEQFANMAIAMNKAPFAVKPLIALAAAATLNPSTLSPVHPHLVMILLFCKFYRQSRVFVDQPILDFSPSISVKGVLLYFYYAGMCHIGLQQFPQAVESFRTCIGVPAQSVSAIVVEAAKKYVLVSLIAYNDVLPYHKWTSAPVQSALPRFLKAYLTLADAYLEGNPRNFEQALQAAYATLQRDHNFGVAKQLRSALQKLLVARLTKTYLTLSLADIAEAAGLPDMATAEHLVVELIASGKVAGRIDKSTNMVSFQDNVLPFTDGRTVATVDAAIIAVNELSARIKVLDEKLAVTPAYLSKAPGRASSARGGAM